ncbi:MAG: hypothetical protein LBG52_02855 [Candidatus Peribacteria bacterium]|nr:hypothetical protein [Candidatus Peribacteria bacterium]
MQYSDREVLVDNEFKIVLENVTSKPQRQTHYPTYNSGYLEYKIRSDTIQIEISRLSFTVDEIVYYGSTGVLENAITVSSIVN